MPLALLCLEGQHPGVLSVYVETILLVSFNNVANLGSVKYLFLKLI